MQERARGLRRHVGIFGASNVGKSSLMNALLQEKAALVSEQAGTTTDPVQVNMELQQAGPVTFIDTAGLADGTVLSELRSKKSEDVMRRCDMAILVIDAETALQTEPHELNFKGPILTVLSRCDRISENEREQLSQSFPAALQVRLDDVRSVDAVRKEIDDMLSSREEEQPSFCIEQILPPKSNVVLVIPIDSEAPKGRLILPQVQLMRELLDAGMLIHVCREHELKDMLKREKEIDLVVTDSQVFAHVDQMVPDQIALTSYSMILARQKGEFQQQYLGTRELGRLKDGDEVLLLEGCKHNATHEDIGRVKIPALLQKKLGKSLQFDFRVGYEMPEDLHSYGAAILCGSCMLNEAELRNRLRMLADAQIPTSNYGMCIAYCQGVLERAAAPLL